MAVFVKQRLEGVARMNVKIYGAGVAGTFLYFLLKQAGFDVSICERRRSSPDCRCAWGITYNEAKALYKEIDVNLDEYVLVRPANVIVNGVAFKNKNVVVFDKKRLLEDLWRRMDIEDVKAVKAQQADVLVDATGYERALLPKIENDNLYPTAQTVEEHDADENIYVYAKGATGYAWAFPLGDRRWHVGVGEAEGNFSALLNGLREKYGFKVNNELFCRCDAFVRLLAPSKCRPFVVGNVVGVGESIGCVSGAGEGNAPSLRCAKLFYECLKAGHFEDYERRVLRHFRWIENEHKFVELVQQGKLWRALPLLPRIVAVESKRAVGHSVADVRALLKLILRS